MHEQITAFVDSAAAAFELKGPIYQLGHWEGSEPGIESSLHQCFPHAAYVTLELNEGVEIDRLPLPDGVARTVLCIGALEYAFRPHRAVEEMGRILSPGGALLVYAPIERPPAAPMSAYWRLTPRTVERLMDGMDATLVGWQGAATFPHTIYGVGFKPPLPGTVLGGTGRFLDRFQTRLNETAGRIGWRQRLKRFLTAWARTPSRHQHRCDYHNVQFTVHFSGGRDLKHALLQSCLPEETTGTRLDLMD